jgi:predicted DsbA family dithiol-disulfide isomerase
MALASDHIRATVVEATEFPDLSRQYRVTGVPKTIVNGKTEILGAVPEETFVEQALQDIKTR